MSRRALGWTAYVAGRGPARRVHVAQPGDPLCGHFVASDRDERRVHVVVQAVTVAAPDRSRIPVAQTPIGLRRLASAALDELASREASA